MHSGLKFFAANYEEPERSGAQHRNLRSPKANSYCSLTPQQAKKNALVGIQKPY